MICVECWNRLDKIGGVTINDSPNLGPRYFPEKIHVMNAENIAINLKKYV